MKRTSAQRISTWTTVGVIVGAALLRASRISGAARSWIIVALIATFVAGLLTDASEAWTWWRGRSAGPGSSEEQPSTAKGSDWLRRDIGDWGTLAKSLIVASALLGFIGGRAHDTTTAWGYFAPAIVLFAFALGLFRYAPERGSNDE